MILFSNLLRGKALIKTIICLVLIAVLVVLFFSVNGPSVVYSVRLSSPPFDGLAVAGNSIVYCGKDKVVYALDAQTGQELWRLGEEEAYATPVISTNRVFVCTLTKKLLCLDLNTGKKLWEHESAGWQGTPVIDAGPVLYGSANCLVALDWETGKERWTYIIERKQSIEKITIADGVAYFGYEQKSDMYMTFNRKRDVPGGLCAIDLKTQKVLWSVDLGNYVVHPPIVTADMVCVTAKSSAISTAYALDRLTGEVRWKLVGADSAPVVAGDFFCLASFDLKKIGAATKPPLMMRSNYFCGLELQTGKQSWARSHRLPYIYQACGHKNLVIFTAKRKLMAIDIRSGSSSWSYTAENEIACPPVISGERLILCTVEGQLLALDLN